MTHGVVLYLVGAATCGFGLAVAWIQSCNHALADELQRVERASFDLEFRIEALDHECVVEVHRALEGLPPRADGAADERGAEGLQ